MQQSTLDLYDQHRSTPIIACGEQPQQRLEAFGVGALSDTELIALMLRAYPNIPAWPATMVAQARWSMAS